MATNFFELATTLKYLGAKWLPGIKVNFTPWTTKFFSLMGYQSFLDMGALLTCL